MIGRMATEQAVRNFLSDLQGNYRGLADAQRQVSTGKRILTPSDDPIGVAIGLGLRRDMSATDTWSRNIDDSLTWLGTTDSALGQVSSLLNDIRGLVTEAANSGAITPDQVAANQLQIDSSLEALNRIAQTTTFQGRRLLDGSLDFITTAGTGFGTVNDLKIDQANLGSTGQVAVSVDITAAATQAQITNGAIAPTVAAVTASDGTVTDCSSNR